MQPRGLAVVCTDEKYPDWTEFDESGKEKKTYHRSTAKNDAEMMKDIWEAYGCTALCFVDQKESFYLNDSEDGLVSQIKRKCNDMEKIEYFVFVASCHGEEVEEAVSGSDTLHQIHHYMSLNESKVRTQDVIDRISDIPELEHLVKIFIIQACRNGYTGDCFDYGVVINDEKVQEELPTAIRKTDNILATVATPQCDNSVVVFASMSGKYAFRRKEGDIGGWLIRALYDSLEAHRSEKEVNVLDVMMEVNRKVSEKTAIINGVDLKAQSSVLHNLSDDFCIYSGN